jgi:2-haloacid dehalogenase
MERHVRYSILLFDLDDTLLDFQANEADALNKVFQLNGYTFSEEMFQAYNTVNKGLWREYESGVIALERVLNTRFSETMSKLGITVDGEAWEDQYRELLGEGHQLIRGAIETCQRLSGAHRLFIVTNGIRKTQIKRLKMSGLYELFEEIFDSQSIGFQKPSKEFFNYVSHSIDHFDAEKALIIGDSLNTDIKGGADYGIDTCWFNRYSQENVTKIQGTFTILKLSELIDICF